MGLGVGGDTGAHHSVTESLCDAVTLWCSESCVFEKVRRVHASSVVWPLQVVTASEDSTAKIWVVDPKQSRTRNLASGQLTELGQTLKAMNIFGRGWAKQSSARSAPLCVARTKASQDKCDGPTDCKHH